MLQTHVPSIYANRTMTHDVKLYLEVLVRIMPINGSSHPSNLLTRPVNFGCIDQLRIRLDPTYN